MATATSARVSATDGLKRLTLIVVAVVAAFFIYENVLPYFVWSEAAYGYYWTYRLPLIAHVTGGLIALLAGVWQIWTGLNAQSMGVHPWTGRFYVLGVLLGSFQRVRLGVDLGRLRIRLGSRARLPRARVACHDRYGAIRRP